LEVEDIGRPRSSTSIFSRVSVVDEVLEFVLSSAFRNTSGDRSEKAQAPTGLIEAGLSV